MRWDLEPGACAASCAIGQEYCRGAGCIELRRMRLPTATESASTLMAWVDRATIRDRAGRPCPTSPLGCSSAAVGGPVQRKRRSRRIVIGGGGGGNLCLIASRRRPRPQPRPTSVGQSVSRSCDAEIPSDAAAAAAKRPLKATNETNLCGSCRYAR